ncbi:MAG TPA: class I SAM-dependent methyltransferase, partial [Patescibacteria group bacterium]|nr:class I SAM-dependent methyltransferase [Patescibacteria group bacterium]
YKGRNDRVATKEALVVFGECKVTAERVAYTLERKLSDRLAAIAAFVPPGTVIADIGTDHAYLPIALKQTGVISRAIAGDIHEGPYLSARMAVEQAGLTDSVQVRKGDGLDVVSPGEVDIVVLAGMGGGTMVKILEGRPAVTRTLSGMVLQPMIGAALLRRWLNRNHWRIQKENLLWEDDILYQIIAVIPGTPLPMEPIMEEIGPVLWEQRHPLLADHLESLLEHTNRVLTLMSVSEEARRSDKYRCLAQQRQLLEEKRQCL